MSDTTAHVLFRTFFTVKNGVAYVFLMLYVVVKTVWLNDSLLVLAKKCYYHSLVSFNHK